MKQFFCTLVFIVLCGSAMADATLGLRIDMAGRQRMLAQRIARTACFIALGIDVERKRGILTSSTELFQSSQDLLSNGGGEHNWKPEEGMQAIMRNGAINNSMKRVMEELPAFYADEPISADRLMILSEEADNLLKTTNALVETLERSSRDAGDHFNPTLAKLVNISGRQRMLIQKIGKEACMVQFSRQAGETITDFTALREAETLFEQTAFALTFSAPKQGVISPPTDELEAENFLVWQNWVAMSVYFHMIEEEDLSDVDLNNISIDIEVFLADLNRNTNLYANLSPDMLE